MRVLLRMATQRVSAVVEPHRSSYWRHMRADLKAGLDMDSCESRVTITLREGVMTQVEEMAEFVHGARFEALGSDTCEILKIRILDSLGCSLGALHVADKCGQPAAQSLLPTAAARCLAPTGVRRADNAERPGDCRMVELDQQPVSGMRSSGVAGTTGLSMNRRN